MRTNTSGYIGRFAPSPSGPLHMGSLVTALVSYLRARTRQGKWHLRIDDIDPPREVEGASAHIIKSLDSHGLHWDGDICYQSQQSAHYDEMLEQLQTTKLTYECVCTRKQIKQAGGIYPGTCRDKGLARSNSATRVRNTGSVTGFDDSLLGWVDVPHAIANEDFIIRRRDALYAYHLASVVDDIRMGITEIVRGADLLLPTACQLGLFARFKATPPETLHVPVLATKPGFKLSKQNHASPLDDTTPSANLVTALDYLNQGPPQDLSTCPVDEVISWAKSHWELKKVPNLHEIVVKTCT